MRFTFAQHEFTALPQRALRWGDATLIADPHFGKADVFRAAGMPIPDGNTAADLQRLDEALGDAKRLIILGDFFHAKASQSEAVHVALTAWRDRHTDLDVSLVLGNHDRHAGRPPDSLGFDVRGEFAEAGLNFAHHPPEAPDTPTLCGHLHPAVRLPDYDGSHVRVPCVCVDEDVLVLPAFGSFTGGCVMEPRPGRRLFAVAAGRVCEVPTTPGLQRQRR
ncbi:MAG: ligase-associated DNA damage response endonuclease PdeM [Planctomycetota bacterium]